VYGVRVGPAFPGTRSTVQHRHVFIRFLLSSPSHSSFHKIHTPKVRVCNYGHHNDRSICWLVLLLALNLSILKQVFTILVTKYHRDTMKIASFQSFVVTLLTLSSMVQAGGVTQFSYFYKGASADASWNISPGKDFCVWSLAYVSATEGTYTAGRQTNTPVHEIYFGYWVHNECTGTSYSADAYGFYTGDINISLNQNMVGATVSAVLDGTLSTSSWADEYTLTQEPFSVTIDVTWSECTLANGRRNISKFNTPTSMFTYKNAEQYASACTLAVTVSTDKNLAISFDPDTEYSSCLYAGQNMQMTMEKKS